MTFTIFDTQISIWMVLFILWGLPLTYYRSKFRKIVYRTDSWTINIQPRFVKETRALIGNIYPEDANYIKMRNFYRVYLFIYFVLFISYIIFK
jgi:thioredoxin-dependent peroxiredoxin